MGTHTHTHSWAPRRRSKWRCGGVTGTGCTYIRGVEEVVHILVGLAGQGQHLMRVVHGGLVGHVLVLDHNSWEELQREGNGERDRER
jgi:hypothetical protein